MLPCRTMRDGKWDAGGTVAGGDLSWPLLRAARLHGKRAAMVDQDRVLTYAELAQRVERLTHAVSHELDVAPGGRVGYLGVNSLAHVECFLGVPSAARILVDLNFRLAQAELEYIASDCGVEALVVDRDQLEVGRALREACPQLRQLVLDAPGDCPEDCIPYERLVAAPGGPDGPAPEGRIPDEIEPSTVAVISYTGGTTGNPKGVMLSHGNLLANAEHNLIATSHASDQRWLHVCPMFHVAGTANVVACTWAGSTQVILPRFDAGAVIDTIQFEQITHTVLVPTMLTMLLEELEERPSADLSSLRHIQYAASPIPRALQQRILERFEFDIVQMYGMTEAAPSVTSLPASDHRRGAAGEQPYVDRLRSVGVPIIGVQAEVRLLDGSPAPAGEVGELWVRGPNVMLGYWNRPDATEEALAGGWYHTGDAARADDDGYLYLIDRLKDMIVTGGENVYPIEVESVLLEHPAVSEAAVFGIPNPRWGESVHAVVTLAEGSTATVEELVEHSRKLIAGYKLPRSIDIRTEPLPKSGAGKLLKRVLREPYWAGHERQVN